MKATARFAVIGAFGLLGLLGLTGCSPEVSLEDRILQDAARGDESIELPAATAQGAPLDGWTSMVVVCPYADPTGATGPFEAEMAKLDPLNPVAEGSQLLIFSDGERIETLRMARSGVDFCSRPLRDPTSPSQRWIVTERGGPDSPIVLIPADG